MYPTTHANARRLALRLIIVLGVFYGGCTGRSTLYPDGYKPRVWCLYLDNERFVAWRIRYDSPGKDVSDAESRDRPLTVPEGTRWSSVDAIEEFEREHWRCEGTMIYLLLLELDSLKADDATRRLTQLFEQRGLFYMPIGPLRTWIGSPGLEAFLESLPERSEAVHDDGSNGE